MSGISMQRYLQHLRCDCSSFRQVFITRPISTYLDHTKRRHHSTELPVQSEQTPFFKVENQGKSSASDTEKENYERDGRKLEQILGRLRDPLSLANHVRRLLQKNDIVEAEKVVVAASKYMKCTVSWNHLINWRSSKGKINHAIMTYNMMKKRAQIPDAHTYAILLSNMSDHVRLPTTLGKALSIYDSMFAPNSKIQATTIHTNAMLKICARAYNMDALYGVMARLEEKGPNSPDALTYTIIFNAMQNHVSKDLVANETVEEMAPLRNKMIIQAREMWGTIMARWRRGDLVIDEELVCSMGRVLLRGDQQDIDDIFSLFQQTMDIPRLIPKIGTARRSRIDPSLQSRDPQGERVATASLADEKAQTNTVQSTTGDKFILPIVSETYSDLRGLPTPGRMTLSLALQAAEAARLKPAVANYWRHLTTTRQIEPDQANYHLYLRCLRFYRAGGEAVELLGQMPLNLRNRTTFELVISTVCRDINNQKAFDLADRVLAMMRESIRSLEPSIYERYIVLAMKTPKNDHNTSKTPSEMLRIRNQRTLQAIQRFSPAIPLLQPFLEEIDGTPHPTEKQQEEKQDIIRLINLLISAHDSVTRSETMKIDEKTKQSLIEGKQYLHRVLHSAINKDSKVPIMKMRAGRKGSGKNRQSHRKVGTKPSR